MTLSTCEINKSVKIVGFSNGLFENYKKRLFQLGFFSGNKLKVCKKSVFKKVLLVEINSYLLSLRNDIAQFVEVEYE